MTNDSDEAHSERERSCKGAAIAGKDGELAQEAATDPLYAGGAARLLQAWRVERGDRQKERQSARDQERQERQPA